MLTTKALPMVNVCGQAVKKKCKNNLTREIYPQTSVKDEQSKAKDR